MIIMKNIQGGCIIVEVMLFVYRLKQLEAVYECKCNYLVKELAISLRFKKKNKR